MPLGRERLLPGNWKQRQTIEADTVVIAMGTKPEDGLYRELEGKVSELYLIGDGKRSGKAFEAVHEGAAVARQI